MCKVFIVKHVWWYDGPVGINTNKYEENILKVFNTEEKAVECVRDYIKCRIDEHLNNPLIPGKYAENVPKASEISEGERCIYYVDECDNYCAYVYDMYDVN